MVDAGKWEDQLLDKISTLTRNRDEAQQLIFDALTMDPTSDLLLHLERVLARD